MRIVDCPQGSPEWLAHRRTTRNASEAPIIMGASPYVTRAELIRQRATGVEREIDAATQFVFDKGHAVEPLLRALAEAYTGEDFYPITATSDDGYLSASFDGVTLDETALLEAKQSNAGKMAQARDGILPPVDRWQVVQQFAVCETATRCLYVIGDGTEEGSVILTVQRSEIEADIPKLMAGWAQFEIDVAAYQPEVEVLPPAAGAPVEGFGSLTLRVEGRVLASNLDGFRAGAEAFLARLPKPENLQTDQDFADADLAVKACAEAESRIKAAKDSALAQMSDVETVMRTADSVGESIRQARLALEKLVTKRKDQVKAEIVTNAAAAVRAHFDTINATLGAHAFQPAQSLTLDLGAAIKGKRTLSSMRDAIDAAVAREKIEASQNSERIRANIAILEQHGEHAALFADRVQLCAKLAPEVVRGLVEGRIAEHQQREAARLEAERERIRKEESDRLEHEQRARDAQAERDRLAAEAAAAPVPVPEPAQPAPAPVVVQQAANTQPAAQAAPAGARIALGDICARIAPLTITAAGLAQLGFQPVATERSAKLYAASSLPQMCQRMRDALTMAETAFHMESAA